MLFKNNKNQYLYLIYEPNMNPGGFRKSGFLNKPSLNDNLVVLCSTDRIKAYLDFFRDSFPKDGVHTVSLTVHEFPEYLI
jgi:hypothetical protein